MRSLLSGSGMTAGAFLVSDMLVQLGVDGRKLHEVDVQRLGRLLAFAALYKGPLQWVMVSLMDAWLPGRGARAVLTKLAVDQAAWAWFINFSFLTYVPFSNGMSLRRASDAALKCLPDVVMDSYKLWPAVKLINYYFMPPSLRIAYVSLVDCMWSGYTCVVANRNAREAMLAE